MKSEEIIMLVFVIIIAITTPLAIWLKKKEEEN